MIKKLILLFIFFILFLCQTTTAFASKITNINFDNSNNMMFIGTNSHNLNCSTTSIKAIKLANPERIYFDIPNTMLTKGNQSWHFKNSPIEQIKTAQFSTNPNVVRFVIYYNEKFNPDNLKFYCTSNNAITVVFDEKYSAKDDDVLIYRSQGALATDLYESAIYADEKNVKKITNNLQQAPSNSTNIEALEQIQKAINLYTTEKTTPLDIKTEREFELKSNYFLKQIDIKRGNALISGTGNVEIANPFTLTNPTRLVIDLPNTIITQNLRNQEFNLTETDKIKLGQFEQSKARIVITTETPEKYLAIFSIGSQSLLIAHEQRTLGLKFSENNTQLTSLKSSSTTNNTESFKITFNNPIVPSIKKTQNTFELSIFNIDILDLEGLKRAVRETKIQPLRVEKFTQNCLKFIFPIKTGTHINVYENVDNKQIELKFTLPKTSILENITKATTNKKIRNKRIIIDAGHGGSDVGAIKNNVYEKDLNLPVALKTAEILAEKGYNVILTRSNDKTLSLEERVEFTKRNKGDVFVSIHANSCAKPEITGIETHYYKNIDYELAQNIHTAMKKYVKTEDRGLFKSKFYVINHNEIPSVLLEIGFMTNDDELEDLQRTKRQNNTAKAIAEGIINYLLGK